MLISVLTFGEDGKLRSHVNPDESMGFALKRLQQALRGSMDAALSEHGLTTPQYLVLAMLAEHPGATNADLARRSYVAPPTMLRMVETLLGVGLLEPAGTRGRRRGYALTPDGQQRVEAASVDVGKFEDLLVSEAGPEQVDVVMSWLRSSAARVRQARDFP